MGSVGGLRGACVRWERGGIEVVKPLNGGCKDRASAVIARGRLPPGCGCGSGQLPTEHGEQHSAHRTTWAASCVVRASNSRGCDGLPWCQLDLWQGRADTPRATVSRGCAVSGVIRWSAQCSPLIHPSANSFLVPSHARCRHLGNA